MFKVPNHYRLRRGEFASNYNDGNNGVFMIPYSKNNITFQIMASDGMGWDHVSVTILRNRKPLNRIPTWDEMCYIKQMFWDKNDAVVQFHPAESEYVNQHKFCLHLWRYNEGDFPIPEAIMVGLK